MKRNGDIRSLFQKAAKKAAAIDPPPHEEQLALCLRYVDKLGRPCEHFIGVVHVDDTTSLSLKKAIEVLLVSNGLSMQQIRG